MHSYNGKKITGTYMDKTIQDELECAFNYVFDDAYDMQTAAVTLRHSDTISRPSALQLLDFISPCLQPGRLGHVTDHMAVIQSCSWK